MMNSKTFRALALDECMKLHGQAFNQDVFTSAMEKCKRHMKNKYGSLDYEEEVAESGLDNVVFFYAESAKGTSQTWNGAKAAKPVSVTPPPTKPATVVGVTLTVLDALNVIADDNSTPEAIAAALAMLA